MANYRYGFTAKTLSDLVAYAESIEKSYNKEWVPGLGEYIFVKTTGDVVTHYFIGDGKTAIESTKLREIKTLEQDKKTEIFLPVKRFLDPIDRDSLESEIDRAQEAEETLTNNLTAETTRAVEAEKTLSESLKTEENRAKQAEETLTTKIDEENVRATAAEAYLKAELMAKLEEEVVRATDAEANLNADLTNKLNEEIIRATEEEEKLYKKIDDTKEQILGEGITETYDTLVEIQSWIENDENGAAAMAAAIASNQAAINKIVDENLIVKTPSYSIDSNIKSQYEVGTYAEIKYQQIFDGGKYLYGPSPTGVTITKQTMFGEEKNVNINTYLVGSYNFYWGVKYNEGDYPVNKLGIKVEKYQIPAGEKVINKEITIYQQGCFAGGFTANQSIARGNFSNTLNSSYGENKKMEFDVQPGAVKVLICVPTGKNKPQTILNTTNNSDMTESFKPTSNSPIEITDASNKNTFQYDAYEFVPNDPYENSAHFSITL